MPRLVFAILAHAHRPCLADLVDNIRQAEPDSGIIVYNCGPDPGLTTGLDVPVCPGTRWAWVSTTPTGSSSARRAGPASRTRPARLLWWAVPSVRAAGAAPRRPYDDTWRVTMGTDPMPGGDAAGAVRAAVTALAELPGVAGVVLGGSRARGTAGPGSDIDLGLYYLPAERPDYRALLDLARQLDEGGEPAGGDYGEWGPWINGGIWMHVQGFTTDILLRDVDRVRTVLEDCAAGRLQVDYQPGHPHAFVSSIYAGEVFHNIAVYDPRGIVADLRTLTDPYPPALAAATTQRFGWEVGFALGAAGGAADRGDVAYVAGCAARAVACTVQVLHAVNRRYLVNEKGGVAAVDALPLHPDRFAARVGAAFGSLSPDPGSLVAALAELDSLRAETEELADQHQEADGDR